MNGHRILSLFFDYVDPASYLLELRLRRMEGPSTFGLAVEPFELSTPPAPLLDPQGPDFVSDWDAMVAAGKELGEDLKAPWIVPWTRKAHELAQQAEKEGCFREIHDTLYRAYLIEGLDIGRVDVLVDLAGRHGLDPMETKVVLDIDAHRNLVVEKRQVGLGVGVSKPPALVLDGRRLDGYPDDQTLSEFLKKSG
jgi:predicted DsbA family dithiol-disulfide isomerase